MCCNDVSICEHVHMIMLLNFCFLNFEDCISNVQIRVSSEISNAPFILNLDCDMYANDVDTIQEALCFFMDEKRGHDISFVQFPQNFDNITKNDIYACSLTVINNVGNL